MGFSWGKVVFGGKGRRFLWLEQELIVKMPISKITLNKVVLQFRVSRCIPGS